MIMYSILSAVSGRTGMEREFGNHPSSHLYDTVYPLMSHTDHLRICVGNSCGTECDTNVPIVRHQIRLRYPVVDTRADSAGRDVRSHRSPHVRRVVTGVSPRR